MNAYLDSEKATDWETPSAHRSIVCARRDANARGQSRPRMSRIKTDKTKADSGEQLGIAEKHELNGSGVPGAGCRVATVQAGGGVVADSQPEFEFEESINKASAPLLALEIADPS